MKILLVGEYSRLHNSLKEGLITLGHEVTLIASGDYFKDYPADIKLNQKFNDGFLKNLKVGIYRLSGIDITSINLRNQFFNYKNQLQDFDIVQFINESPLGILPKHEKEIISFLKENNKKLFLLSCGTDYVSVKYASEKKLRYSIFTPFFEGRITKRDFNPVLKYLRPNFIDLHHFVYKNVEKVIASDMDYHLPLENHPKYYRLIPNPINTDKITFIPNKTTDKIIIFHGVNRNNYYKKGNDLFDAALNKIQEKYTNNVEIIRAENIPYVQYIEYYNKAHILLDQVYAYDQGYNALEAMAKGKVVFTGAEKEFLTHYHLQEDEVCINALPNVDLLVDKLSWLIENPKEIEKISKNARAFIEEEHHYVKVAEKYCNAWQKT